GTRACAEPSLRAPSSPGARAHVQDRVATAGGPGGSAAGYPPDPCRPRPSPGPGTTGQYRGRQRGALHPDADRSGAGGNPRSGPGGDDTLRPGPPASLRLTWVRTDGCPGRHPTYAPDGLPLASAVPEPPAIVHTCE